LLRSQGNREVLGKKGHFLNGKYSSAVMSSSSHTCKDPEFHNLLHDKDARNTKRATNVALNIFNSYLTEKKLTEPEDKKELAMVLQEFYTGVRKVDGTQYSKGSLNSLRCALRRHFKASHGFDLVNDPEFINANKVFGAKSVVHQQQGLGIVDHTSVISKEDLQKLYNSGVFCVDTPVTLQNKVFFELMLDFYSQFERQNFSHIKKNDFDLRVDSSGRKYVCRAGDGQRVNKIHDVVDSHGQKLQGVMVETGGPQCPVTSLTLYISRLNPLNDSLFQRPRKNFSMSDKVWYDFTTVGERTLKEKMKSISKEAQLSQVYTNQSIRVTAMSVQKQPLSGACISTKLSKDHTSNLGNDSNSQNRATVIHVIKQEGPDTLQGALKGFHGDVSSTDHNNAIASNGLEINVGSQRRTALPFAIKQEVPETPETNVSC